MSQRRPSRIPLGKKVLFGLAACAMGLGLLEALFRVTGIGVVETQADQFAGFSVASPIFERNESSENGCQFQTSERKLEWLNPQQFPCQKTEGTKRVFCLGGSTTYGRPYDDKTSFCGWLREFLPVADAATKWEVINAGGISYGSRRVLTALQEVVTYQPDLVVIYCGHNEFLERTTYSRISSLPSSVVDLSVFLEQYSNVFRSVRNLVGSNSTQQIASPEETEDVKAILDSSVGLDAYQRDPLWQAEVIAAYRDHIRAMMEICRSQQTAVVFVIPASQLKDCAPFKSEHTNGLSLSDIVKSESLYDQASALMKTEDYQACINVCRQLLETDPEFAHGHYLLGMAQYEAGQFDLARKSFADARDLDICPLRATTAILQTLRDVVQESDCNMVDFEQLVVRVANHGIPGTDLFLDHVHPTIDANRQLALELISTLQTDGVMAGEKLSVTAVETVTDRVLASIDSAVHGLALRNLSKVLSWAGKYDEADQLAIRAMDMLPDDSEAMYQGGSAYFRAGDLDGAKLAYQKAVALDPESAQAQFGMGLVFAEQGDWESAIVHYRIAATLKPDFPDIEFNLGRALEQSGDLDAAQTQYEKCLQLNAQFAPACNGMGTVFARRGDFTQAIVWFRRAIKLDPDDPIARNNLDMALAQQPN